MLRRTNAQVHHSFPPGNPPSVHKLLGPSPDPTATRCGEAVCTRPLCGRQVKIEAPALRDATPRGTSARLQQPGGVKQQSGYDREGIVRAANPSGRSSASARKPAKARPNSASTGGARGGLFGASRGQKKFSAGCAATDLGAIRRARRGAAALDRSREEGGDFSRLRARHVVSRGGPSGRSTRPDPTECGRRGGARRGRSRSRQGLRPR